MHTNPHPDQDPLNQQTECKGQLLSMFADGEDVDPRFYRIGIMLEYLLAGILVVLALFQSQSKQELSLDQALKIALGMNVSTSTLHEWKFWPQLPNKPKIGLGTSGKAVEYLQGVLAMKAHADVEISGYFGISTKVAIQEMQLFFDMPTNGVVDEKTWELIDWLALL